MVLEVLVADLAKKFLKILIPLNVMSNNTLNFQPGFKISNLLMDKISSWSSEFGMVQSPCLDLVNAGFRLSGDQIKAFRSTSTPPSPFEIAINQWGAWEGHEQGLSPMMAPTSLTSWMEWIVRRKVIQLIFTHHLTWSTWIEITKIPVPENLPHGLSGPLNGHYYF